jgi:pimeloyl-ACP methyl ester carboxylesterase
MLRHWLVLGTLASLLITHSSSAQSREEIGSLERAQFRIFMPDSWNGSLVLWCHGYDSAPGSFRPGRSPDSLAKALLQKGFSYAESGYSAGGIAVNEAVADTERLRGYFSRKYGRPKRVFVLGESMGGTVALALIESAGANYSGGLAFCGMLGTPAAFLRSAFDSLALFASYAPDILPPPGKVPEGYKPNEQLIGRVLQALETDARASAALKIHTGVRNNEELAGMLVFHTDAIRDLTVRCGGNAFDNRSTLYTASADSVSVNKRVPRFEAVRRAAACAKALPGPRGALKMPFLAVDPAYDPIVAAWVGNSYGERIAGTPAASWFVRQFVPASGHCSIPLQTRLDAFEQLVNWVGNPAARPKPGLR